MGPLGAATTVEKVAINAVMAGCRPTTCRSSSPRCGRCCAPSTTSPRRRARRTRRRRCVVVSGPLATPAAIAGGFGALGPGHRANASIGRPCGCA